MNGDLLVIGESTETTEEVVKISNDVIYTISDILESIIGFMDQTSFQIGDIEFSYLDMFCFSAFVLIGFRIVVAILWESD